MDLNDIALFVSVVRAGSFAEAGRRLGIPPSTGSRRLQALEQSLGVRLLQRSTRRLVLTDAGHSFFAECAEQIDSLTQAAQDLSESGKRPKGKIRVAAGVDFLNWFPLEKVAEFLSTYPGVSVEFVLSDARSDLLADGIDVALRAGEMREPTLVAREIGRVQWRLVASPGYLQKHGVPLTPEHLADHQCITSSTHGTSSVWRLRGKKGMVDVPVKGHFQVNTMQAQLAGALGGLGIAMAPTVTVRAHIESGTLREVLPECSLEFQVYFVYPSRRHIPRAVRAFTDFAAALMIERGMLAPASPKKLASPA